MFELITVTFFHIPFVPLLYSNMFSFQFTSDRKLMFYETWWNASNTMALICLRMKSSNNAIYFQGKPSKRNCTIHFLWNFTQKTNPALTNESSWPCAIRHWKLLNFFACFQFVLSNFFPIHKYIYNFIMFTLLSGEYFPLFINFFFFCFFLLFIFHIFLWFYFCFLPPHRKEISYFSICWNKQL